MRRPVAVGVALILVAGGAQSAARASGGTSEEREAGAAFLKRAMPLGNLGSVTPNARRYAISPDWKALAAPLDSGSVLMFDLDTAEPRPPLEGGFKVGTFTNLSGPCRFGFSADGRLVYWTWGKKVVAWDATTREVLLKQEIEGLDGWVRVSPDGRTLAWSTAQGLTLWNLTKRAAEAAPGPEQAVWVFGREGRLLQRVSAPQEKLAELLAWRKIGDLALPDDGFSLWNVTTGAVLTSPYTAGPWTWSADGRFFAVVNANLDVEIRDQQSADRPPRVLPGREKGNRGRCTFWDSETTRGGPQLLLSHDGRVLADSCRVTDIWDLSQPVPALVMRTGLLRQEAGRPVLSRDGRTLAYAWGGGSVLGGDGGFGLIDVPSARPVGTPIAVKYLGAMELSPDGASLATVGFVPRPGVKTRFEVQIWDVGAIRAAAGPAR